jgi:5'(3')-deoxyribonucleotidase
MKPILLMDVDGVLANFIEAVLSVLRDEFGVMDYHHDTIETWEMFASMPEHIHLRDNVYEILKKYGGCFGIPPYPGSQNGVAALKKLVDVVIVTSPFYGSDTWVAERERWLEKFFDISHKDVIHTGRKELVDGDIFVDDKVEHVVKWARAHPSKHAILWAQRYNEKGEHEGFPNVTRIGSWSNLLTAVRSTLVAGGV